jgi:hypothetical protein
LICHLPAPDVGNPDCDDDTISSIRDVGCVHAVTGAELSVELRIEVALQTSYETTHLHITEGVLRIRDA